MTEGKSNYIVLSRKYRPTVMSELVGQEILTKALTHSMINNKLSHAYLLSGIRGIGKTTAARIIARTINCFNPVINQDMIGVCGYCNSCFAIKNNSHPDISEVDAASRTGIDDIRKIIEDSEYKPLLATYKIFIIDEVHMLSKSAFNALLKSLEEPPPHVIFIFATTEINKIPLTVISRCQKFDLRRLSQQDIIQILTNIAFKEKITVTNEALEFITLKADGSARDAISLFEQANSLSQNASSPIISLDIVKQMCGVVNLGNLIQLLSEIINQNANRVINIIEDLYIAGVDFIACNENIIDLLGYLTKIKTISDYTEPVYNDHNIALNDIKAKLTIARLTILWQIFNKAAAELKVTHNQKLSFEITTIKAIYSFSLPTPAEAIKQLQNQSITSVNQQEEEINKSKIYSTIDRNNKDLNKELMDYSFKEQQVKSQNWPRQL